VDHPIQTLEIDSNQKRSKEKRKGVEVFQGERIHKKKYSSILFMMEYSFHQEIFLTKYF
jgi:hypothetical protein